MQYKQTGNSPGLHIAWSKALPMVFPKLYEFYYDSEFFKCPTLPGSLAGKVCNIPCDLGNIGLHEVKQFIISGKQAKLSRAVTLYLIILQISKKEPSRTIFLLPSLVHEKCYSNNDHKNNNGNRLQLLCIYSLNKLEVNREEYRSKSRPSMGLAPASLLTAGSLSYFNCPNIATAEWS